MNRLVIIGNGFDMAHGLKTSYMDFINWYWDQRVNSFLNNHTNVSEDCLCRLVIRNKEEYNNWYLFLYQNRYFFYNTLSKERTFGSEVIQEIRQHPKVFSVECCPFFETILQSIETKGWVDIENDYYQTLKNSIDSPRCDYNVIELNKQLSFLQNKLVEYLKTIGTSELKNDLNGEIVENFNPADFSTEGKKRALRSIGLENYELAELSNKPYKQQKLRPKRTMLLSFNYTGTAKMYAGNNIELNFIHGDLEHPENIIFGYGDELDKNYQDILDKNNNEFLRNVKSVKYLETRHYHELLEFLLSAPFQVLIMGHSCGNSDRTLLNTVFEHENCVSIKPFYHKWDDGRDNYLELVQNISRNFTNMKLFRDRVVNKEQCKTM